MRGTLPISFLLSCDAGIIPAYAGNTSNGAGTARSWWDHPRVCGEHPRQRYFTTVQPGSSPRMRGTHDFKDVVVGETGIIPAYAGNTNADIHVDAIIGDHPRVCGEHPYRIIPIPEDMGSSPRMRGTRSCRGCGVVICGIIPAYAGNTSRMIKSAEGIWDHPRVCGEHPSS